MLICYLIACISTKLTILCCLFQTDHIIRDCFIPQWYRFPKLQSFPWHILTGCEIVITFCQCLVILSTSVRPKISWTSAPAQCDNSGRFCPSSLTPLAQTKRSKLAFHWPQRWPTGDVRSDLERLDSAKATQHACHDRHNKNKPHDVCQECPGDPRRQLKCCASILGHLIE